MTDQTDLNDAIDAVAISTGGPADLRKMLIRITDLARATVMGADFASVTIRHRSGRLETVAPSSPLLYVADALQYEFNEGPCYDAVTDDIVMYCPDLAHDSRWPQFGPKANRLGLSSLLAVRLVHPGVTLLALNLYSDAIAAFEDHEKVARRFIRETAAYRPAISVDAEMRLHADLATQVTVDNATGILMQRHGIDAQAALELLRELAADHSRGRPLS